MLDIQTITYEEAQAEGKLAVIGQLCLTEAIVLDPAQFADHGGAIDTAALNEARKGAIGRIALTLWHQAYGEALRKVREMQQRARGLGDLAQLNSLSTLEELLTPKFEPIDERGQELAEG
jgi:hypothetical protein